MLVPRRRRRLRFAQRKITQIGLGALALSLLPSAIGFQDLGALLARQPAVAERARERLIASPFGTIHAAMFSMPRPVGTAIPPPPIYALANFDPADITGSIGRQPLGDPSAPLQFPMVNRKTKSDSAISRARDPLPPLPPMLAIEPIPDAQADASAKDSERFESYSEYEFPEAPCHAVFAPDVDLPYVDMPPVNLTAVAPKDGSAKDAGRLFFGADALDAQKQAIA